MTIDKNSIEHVHEKIKPYIHQTPILTSSAINSMCGAQLFFKCENFQKVGAFKYRGATNAILSLSEEEQKAGVTTHSSGNHAQALALAASKLKIKAKIVMPETAPKVKIAAVKGYGAEVILCPATQADRESYMQNVIDTYGCTPIHPFDDYKIIEGQATVAKEILDEVDAIDYIFSPVGGGGLLAGTVLSAKYFSSKAKVIGCEPLGADDAYRSVQARKRTPISKPSSIADGLLTTIGEKNFPIILDGVEEIICVSDEEIVSAMRLVWERMKIIIEPSAAVTLAVVLKRKDDFKDKKLAIILSGGNVDLSTLPF